MFIHHKGENTVANPKTRKQIPSSSKGGEQHEQQSASVFIEDAPAITETRDSIRHRDETNGENGQDDVSANGIQFTTLDTTEEVEAAVIDIAPFITNPDGNVYAVTNLPEEFVAVLFAWVSRSPKSFKEHLVDAIRDGLIPPTEREAFEKLTEKAQKFHEKWTVGYGHSSVAEHAMTHVGIEKVSRLASAELELSNTFYSITEYSQRYQKPQRGNWYNPFFPYLAKRSGSTMNPYFEKFETFMHESFDVFEQLIEGVYKHLTEDCFFPSSEIEAARIKSNMMKLAFEDARYALPLAMYTQLGMTASGRAWRDGIVNLYNSDYPEVHTLARDLKTEITKVLPTLLKYATPSNYLENSKKRLKHHLGEELDRTPSYQTVRLIGSRPHERLIISNIIAKLYVQEQGLPYDEALSRAQNMSDEKRDEIINDLLFEISSHDNPPEVFKTVDFDAELLISEANWHQLLRHNRKTDFIFHEPNPYHGITIPPRIKEAGLEHLLVDLAKKSEALYEELGELGAYVILNAHRRRVVAHFDLWEAYHLINLRTSEHAQWDIRQTFNDLYDQLNNVCPRLIQYAKRR
jgi:thymidylate synthase ThyX